MQKKAEEKTIPYFPKEWGVDEFQGKFIIQEINQDYFEKPEEIHIKRTPGSTGTNQIDWNSPNDSHGEFL